MSNQLSPSNKKTLLLSLNTLIRKNGAESLNRIANNEYEKLFFYPPNEKLTGTESEMLIALQKNPAIYPVLQKIITNESARVIFELLNWVDGTGDPDGPWSGVALVDRTSDEDTEMLHDAFLEAYWETQS
ncbi:MAG: hypothetical protein WC813_03035 [Patescibacteria group bacterium]|jgi:hypothetical protein